MIILFYFILEWLSPRKLRWLNNLGTFLVLEQFINILITIDLTNEQSKLLVVVLWKHTIIMIKSGVYASHISGMTLKKNQTVKPVNISIYERQV